MSQENEQDVISEKKTSFSMPLIALAIIAIVVGGFVFLLESSGILNSLNRKAYDAQFMVKHKLVASDSAPNSTVVLLQIDDKTLNRELFQIPKLLWQTYYAKIITALADGGAKVILLDLPLPKANFDHIVPEYSTTWLDAFGHAKEGGTRIVTWIERTRDQLLLPEDKYIQTIGEKNMGIIAFNLDDDGFSRKQQLMYPPVKKGGKNLYNVAYLVAKAYKASLEMPAEMIHLNFDAGRDAFARLSFGDVYDRADKGDEKYFKTNFNGKIVLIGDVSSMTRDRYATPLYHVTLGDERRTPGIEVIGHTVNTLLIGEFNNDIGWWAKLLICIGLAALISFYTLFSHPKNIIVLLPAVLVFWFIGSMWAYIWFTILPLPAGIISILVAQVASLGAHYRLETMRVRKAEAESAEVSRMLGLSFQKQGMLDQAFEKYKRLPVNDSALELMYNLGRDFEEKNRGERALAVYDYIAEHKPEYTDIPERRAELEKLVVKKEPAGQKARPTEHGGTHDIEVDGRQTLGRYELLRELGHGAMGTVYLGQDPKIGRMTAIKTIRFTDEYEEEEAEKVKAQFFREAETAGLLSHPNIVTIYDAGEEDDLSYIAMELLEGHDLNEHATKKDLLPVRTVLGIVAGVADGLDYAHQRGVVHRDVKPANIMYLKDGTAKITDFGVARAMASSKTKTGVIKGTPFYMSPEQIMGKKVDGRSDIFSLGVVLYELLSGRQPFRADDLSSLIHKITQEDPEPVSQVNPKVPKVVDKIISKALVKDRDERYQQAKIFAAHLKKVIHKMDQLNAKKA